MNKQEILAEIERLKAKVDAMPDDLKKFKQEYSNYDCVVPKGAEKALKTGEYYVEHPAWNHWGMIYFKDGKFIEQVLQYGSVVGIVEGDTLEQVFKNVNDKYGWG